MISPQTHYNLLPTRYIVVALLCSCAPVPHYDDVTSPTFVAQQHDLNGTRVWIDYDPATLTAKHAQRMWDIHAAYLKIFEPFGDLISFYVGESVPAQPYMTVRMRGIAPEARDEPDKVLLGRILSQVDCHNSRQDDEIAVYVDTPCFGTAENPPPAYCQDGLYVPTAIASTVAHEIGHALGLEHTWGEWRRGGGCDIMSGSIESWECSAGQPSFSSTELALLAWRTTHCDSRAEFQNSALLLFERLPQNYIAPAVAAPTPSPTPMQPDANSTAAWD